MPLTNRPIASSEVPIGRRMKEPEMFMDSTRTCSRRGGGGWGLNESSHPQRTDAEKRSEEHTSELQSLMRTSYAVFCLKTQRFDPRQRPHMLQHGDVQHARTQHAG